ncbi:histone-lysine N-methyltransferase, H3 lysine-79 specific-like [Harpegnathos saltator]|uniref:histone-lysine N-methyltransferase, H3 lysine-79 specific-like n=1 Tax=Harpegnathos saltator TaxID=610380 RepID=UPI00058C9B89|nr:histone-lysine N-methyltransferase, H3 lysine-79 specific-like [Harpegnathos saltator]
MVFKASSEWASQDKETPKQGTGKNTKRNKGKGIKKKKEMEKELGEQRIAQQHGNNMQDYPQLPSMRSQRKEHQTQPSKEETPTPQKEMSKVVGRREKKKEKEEQKRQKIRKVVNIERKEGKKIRRRVPNTAAVTITAERGQYKDLLAEAKRKIDLTEIGIEKIKTRVGATGALVLEIPGEEKGKQADLLADKLKEVLTDRTKVSRPQKMGEL